MRGERWQENELLAAFALYCRTSFGLFHTGNEDIVELADLLDRTPGAVAMKLSNFAALDPVEQARGISGLQNWSNADEALWEGFQENPTDIALASEEALAELGHSEAQERETGDEVEIPSGPTETTARTRVRVLQGFFRRTVLASYNTTCAVCRIMVKELLVASHIIPWSVEENRRADPRNGMALCALHDRAFDRGLLTVDEELNVVVSKRLLSEAELPIIEVAFSRVHGEPIKGPRRFAPAPEALEYHRQHVFQE